MDPAHIRIMQAADPENLPEALTSITGGMNHVLLFPQHGSRPIKYEMDGDLHGDEDLFIWDPKLEPEAEIDAISPHAPKKVKPAKQGSTVGTCLPHEPCYVGAEV